MHFSNNVMVIIIDVRSSFQQTYHSCQSLFHLEVEVEIETLKY